MIYQFTGQPGHGKTLCAIAKAMEFKEKGRRVFVCNVRDFDYEKTGMEPFTPDQFRDWPNHLPDGSVLLVDEVYEKGMLPKRPAASKVPPHVERLGTHRHHGVDFIFVCQSPDKQMDGFVHDLIEEHVHVRRRFGTKFQHLRVFDRFERNPEKATPLVVRRQTLPKHVFGLYKSTELDTTERKIPWYYIALAIGLPLGIAFFIWTFGGMKARWTGEAQAGTVVAVGDAAQAAASNSEHKEPMSTLDYIARFVPRIPSQPWSAEAYDDMSVSSDPPRLFCMSAGVGDDALGRERERSCSCLTEQGTRYRVEYTLCRRIAREGQYEPYFSESTEQRMDGLSMQNYNADIIRRQHEAQATFVDAPQVATYGDIGVPLNPGG